MIEGYSFGSIQISGKRYTSDLVIGPAKIHTDWWRKKGHSLCLNDLKAIIDWEQDVLVVGTGASGMMSIPSHLYSDLQSKGIKLEVAPTPEAIKKFNRYLEQGKKVVGAFHLTC